MWLACAVGWSHCLCARSVAALRAVLWRQGLRGLLVLATGWLAAARGLCDRSVLVACVVRWCQGLRSLVVLAG
ncbi:hypothetical protein B0I32_130141 [Nonomuraea fuscirosea]|uniref:Uncharacterized protein n=1 Tax=Nonomuraea fuscirosea TaxID=1291556 RepID=A0A2T0M5Z1_9ACTN|nr:hypothetical protein B0I32_130141 [Nonomuraea fuscirosea]